jgi:hypothetical protein
MEHEHRYCQTIAANRYVRISQIPDPPVVTYLTELNYLSDYIFSLDVFLIVSNNLLKERKKGKYVICVIG